MSGVCLSFSPPYFSQTGSATEPRACLCSPLSDVSSGLQMLTGQAFAQMVGIQTLALRLSWEALYQLSQLSGPLDYVSFPLGSPVLK